jgi:citrate lyase subunit beta/citryl-CoA lyase
VQIRKGRKIEVNGISAVRSVLFLPASNPRAISRARESAADLVILDLEDAVKPEDKEMAREAAVEAVATEWPMPTAIRVNGAGTEWHSLDIDAAARSSAQFAVLPRAESAHMVRGVADAIGKPLLAMIESPAGVLSAAEIASECAGLIAGTNDLRVGLRIPIDTDRSPIAMALQTIVLAARAAAIAVFDGVFNDLEDLDGFAIQCAEGRRLGFDGKSLIHPKQIEPCNQAFLPTDDEIARAKRLVEAYGGGAERFEGQMIERMHVEVARRALDRAGGVRG